MSNEILYIEDRDLDKAIEKGLRKMEMKREDVDIEIVEEPKSFMGIDVGKYKIKLRVKENILIDESKAELAELDEIIIEEDFYELLYKEDGVYLQIHSHALYYESVLNEIKNRLSMKDVNNYDENIVVKALQDHNDIPVKIAPPQKEIMVNAQLVLKMSPDRLSCKATLIPPDGGNDLKIEEAYEIVNQQVKYGLIDERLKSLINDKMYLKGIIIAEGKRKVDGEDGTIRYFFDTEKTSAPQILDDGSVDFRSLGLINNVKNGEVLAEVVHPKAGEPGIDILGNPIPQQQGKEATLKYGKNIRLSEDGLKYIASCDGQACLEGDKLEVYQVFEVPGDVDTSTGNIEFNGVVIVRGNVRTGFQIKSTGYIEVRGVVEGAIIESEGNIILKRGIQGYHNGKLYSKENVLARYIENCYIYAEGNIESDAIMHSEVISEESINVTGKKGLIVGGVCKAKGDIHAKTIGSPMETSTVLEVGVDPSLKKKCESLKKELDSIGNNVEKLDKSITLLSRLSKSNSLTDDKKKMLIKFLQARKQLNYKEEELKMKITELDLQIETLSNGKIIVDKIIYPGVKVVIGNSVIFIKEAVRNCTIYKDNGEIKISQGK